MGTQKSFDALNAATLAKQAAARADTEATYAQAASDRADAANLMATQIGSVGNMIRSLNKLLAYAMHDPKPAGVPEEVKTARKTLKRTTKLTKEMDKDLEILDELVERHTD